MRFDTAISTSLSSYMLIAVPDDVADGCPPVDHLAIDININNLSPGNQAVAGVIAFEEYIGQDVTVKGQVPRMVQRAITDFFSDRPVTVGPVTDIPVRTWPSAGTIHLTEFDRYLVPPRTPLRGSHDYFVQVADGAHFNGVLASAHQIIVASNAAMISRLRNVTFRPDALLIAIAVLLSRDLHIRNVHIGLDGDGAHLGRYQQLLRAVDLNLSWGCQQGCAGEEVRLDRH